MTRRTTYLSPARIRLLDWLIGLGGLVAVIAGPLYWVNGGTQAGGSVEVPVQLPDAASGAAPAVAGLPEGARVTALGTDATLSAAHSTLVEQLLARGDVLLLGLAVGAGAWLLRPVLGALAAGRPFGGGNARRLAQLACLVAGVGVVAPVLPQLAAIAVLDRLQVVDPDGPFTLGVHISFAPVLAGVLLLLVAETFRQGEQQVRQLAPA